MSSGTVVCNKITVEHKKSSVVFTMVNLCLIFNNSLADCLSVLADWLKLNTASSIEAGLKQWSGVT